MFFITIIFCIICNAFAQTPGFGSCPDVNIISSFDSSEYSGLWYESQRSKLNIQEYHIKCLTSNFSLLDNSTMKVVVKSISELTDIQSEVTALGNIDVNNCENSTNCGKLVLEFPIGIIGHERRKFWIIDTDYTSYSVIWSCTKYLFTHIKYLWVMTRDANPSKSTLELAADVILKNRIDNVQLAFTNQLDCP